MPSSLVFGVPRSGTTYLGKLFAKANECSLYISEPVRTLDLYPNSLESYSIKKALADLGIDLEKASITNIGEGRFNVCMKETLRFHVENDKPTAFWVKKIRSEFRKNSYFESIYYVLRHPVDTLESILNRNGSLHDYPEFEKNPYPYLESWTYNINESFIFAKLHHLLIVRYEDYIRGRHSLSGLLPSFMPHDVKDFSGLKVLGIGDERALGVHNEGSGSLEFKRYRLNNDLKRFSLSRIDDAIKSLYV